MRSVCRVAVKTAAAAAGVMTGMRNPAPQSQHWLQPCAGVHLKDARAVHGQDEKERGLKGHDQGRRCVGG